MLRCESVTIRQDNFALRAHWAVPSGGRVAILGPSGAGKSSLLAAIGGFVPLAEGRITVQGRDVTHTHPAERGIATLFQEHNLFPALTLAQNVGLGLEPALRLSRGAQDQVEAALGRVGLHGLSDRRPDTLSLGQRVRAALARVLLSRQPILCLDEPFAALGPALRLQMTDLVAEVQEATGALLMMVTHHPEDARRIADDLIFVDNGIAHPPQPLEAAFTAPPPALKAYLG